MFDKIEIDTINHLLNEKFKQNSFLISAHQGTHGANIIPNTISAFTNAIKQNANIVELDIIKSTDGQFYVFHDGNELRLLGTKKNIKTMSSTEIEAFNLLNAGGLEKNEKVNKLEDVMVSLKGNCLINFDRCWDYWEEIIPIVIKHHMQNQIIFKSGCQKKYLELLQKASVPMMYMPIISSYEEFETVMGYHLNTVALELIINSEEHIFTSDEFISKCKGMGLHLWVNAITLADTMVLSALHDDNKSICESYENGWGWLINK
ncbi:MAG: glycerophosphodiester phosphodiesterase family protein, partial [Oscillospiraceae bacterium]